MQPASRVGRFTESVIREQTRLAQLHGAINLAQGFPDFDPPPEIVRALSDVLAKGGSHQYANTWGAPEFRAALADKISMFSGREVDPDRELTATCGSTEAMIASLMAILNPGDGLAVFSPFYENYNADGILSGARTVHVKLHAPDWSFDRAELRAAFSEHGCKAIVVCNPSNPCGKVFTREELTEIGVLLEEFDAVAVTDEVYEHIVFDGNRHVHMSTLPGMEDRVICCSSLSKTYSITGWRLGYAWASPKWTDAIRKVHDFLTVGAAHPLQIAAVTGLRSGPDHYARLTEDYSRKRDILCRHLDRAGLPYLRPQGAYFLLADVSSTGMDDTAFCRFLTEKIGVAAVPGSSFFESPVTNLVRFHFSRKDETLEEAGQRLERLRELV